MAETETMETRETHHLEATFRTTFKRAISRMQTKAKLVSETFVFRDHSWNVSLGMDASKNIRCYLNCLETNPGFSCRVSYKFSAICTEGHPLKEKWTTVFDESNRVRIIGLLWRWPLLIEYGFISGDALTIHVELKTELPPTFLNQDENDKLIRSLQPSVTKGLIKDMDEFLESGDGDVTFKMRDGSMIKAHKSFLCARNPVFATMLSVDMKEAKTKEIMIDDMGKSALKTLLLHIYSGQLSLPEGLDLDSCKEVVNAAEKYNLPELKEVAGMALMRLCNGTNDVELFNFCRERNVKKATKMLFGLVANEFFENFVKQKF